MATTAVLRSVQLPDPMVYRPPEPDPGCAVCAELQRLIDLHGDPHGDSYDPSKAIDHRIALARHKAGKGAE
ncbi:hypothetical protein GCM10011578_083120 [Streptomyces fuscichromogenes]|uniref:Uncharacterized protein n=1 Tax=Streptomyces fuscichromogenes TaxID=1324013 RepID=A0A917XMW6_9ACTN|nr:hypothetical protein GCM10011578_083120 [Streptomyces fuscichromogenes]